jgi:hypothetical protein
MRRKLASNREDAEKRLERNVPIITLRLLGFSAGLSRHWKRHGQRKAMDDEVLLMISR